MTRLRRDMFRWLQGPGLAYKRAPRGMPMYLEEEKRGQGSSYSVEERDVPLRPFPLNRAFVSQPVLSEELREEIYKRIVMKKRPIKTVSAELGIAMDRIAAVVRLKTVEKNWTQEVSEFPVPERRTKRIQMMSKQHSISLYDGSLLEPH
jgi:hypothetical protein